MKVSIFGSGKITQKIAEDLAREKNKVQIFYREGEFSQSLFDLEGVRLISYDDYMELDSYLDDLAKEDNILLLEKEDADNFLLARMYSSLPVSLNLLVHDPKKARFLENHEKIFHQAALYCPGQILARSVEKFYYEDRGLLTETFEAFQLSLLRYPIEDQVEFVGRRVRDIGAFDDLVLLAIRRHADVLIPDGNMVFEKNDRLYLTGGAKSIRRFKRRHHIYKERLGEDKKGFIIFGKNRKALAIGHGLVKRGADVTFIGKENISAKEWTNIFPQATYRSLDDRGYLGLLEDLRVGDCDGLIACSQSDGDNVLALMAAYSLGMRASTLFIQDASMLSALDTEKVAAVYTINHVLAHHIKKSLIGPRDLSQHLLPGSIEIYQVRIKEDARAAGKTIENLDLPKGFLIGGIIRQADTSIIPKGNVRILPGDRLLIFMIPEVAFAIRKFLSLEPQGNLITDLLDIF